MGKELDFSRFDNLGYQGLETAEQKAEHDALIERGFTVTSEKTPFEEAVPKQQPRQQVRAAPVAVAQKKTRPPLLSADGRRDYRAMYRAACEFHERHATPPAIGKSEAYWESAVEDMRTVALAFNNDPFLVGMLGVVYTEMENQWKIATNRF